LTLDTSDRASTDEFIAAKLSATRAEMGTAILNRGRWDKLREDCRILEFLKLRSEAPDFQGVREELNRVTEGRLRVPDISGPRGKAAECLKRWDVDLKALEPAGASDPEPKDVTSPTAQ